MIIETELINKSVSVPCANDINKENSLNSDSLNVLYDDNVVPKRKRNRYWIQANSITKETFWPDYAYGDRYFYRRQGAKEIVELANIYHKTVKSKTIWLSGHGSQGGRYHLLLPYTNRFDVEYMKEQVIKIRKAFKGLELHGSILFLTLTIDPKRYPSLYEGHKDIQKKVNHLLTVLRKKFPVVFRYVKISEDQTKNTFNVHYHIAMSIRSLIDYNVMHFDENDDIYHFVKNFWDYERGKYHMGTAETELVEEIHDGLSNYLRVTGYETVNHHTEKFVRKYNGTIQGYMLKYLYKAINPKDDNELIGTNNAILWALNSRIFSHSNIEKWREDNDLIMADKNNSKLVRDEFLNAETITWEYRGLLFSDEIGYLSGIYKEKELAPSILELLYRKYFSDHG